MSIVDRVNQIKEKNNKAIIEQAKAEERLKHLEEQKAQIEARCKELNIDPEKLDTVIREEEEKVEKLIKEAEGLLGIDTIEEDPF